DGVDRHLQLHGLRPEIHPSQRPMADRPVVRAGVGVPDAEAAVRREVVTRDGVTH
ncbi:MAG: hypothetical protein HGA93_02455, partial [Methanothrix sp.]|nr:hypothetical protein [Methanothrix sp.]